MSKEIITDNSKDVLDKKVIKDDSEVEVKDRVVLPIEKSGGLLNDITIRKK